MTIDMIYFCESQVENFQYVQMFLQLAEMEMINSIIFATHE